MSLNALVPLSAKHRDLPAPRCSPGTAPNVSRDALTWSDAELCSEKHRQSEVSSKSLHCEQNR